MQRHSFHLTFLDLELITNHSAQYIIDKCMRFYSKSKYVNNH